MKTTLTNFEDLKRIANHFVTADSNIIIVGAPGLSKTTIIEDAVGDLGHKLDGNVTAFELYKWLFHHRDELIILDDIDSLYGNKSAIRMLKQACQTTPIKSVSWHSNHPDIGDGVDQVPATFETTSRFIIIANEWKTLNRNVHAIEDRGIMISFEPTAQEVHNYVSGWFRDREVLQFIESILPAVSSSISARMYIGASNLRKAGLPWRENVCKEMGVSERTFKLLELEESTLKPMERVKAYQQATGASQAAYYRHVKKLKRPARVEVLS